MRLDQWLFMGAILAFWFAEFFRTKGYNKMSQATDRLSASISAFAVSLNTFMSRPIPEDDTAALNAAADQIDALKAKLDAVTPPATPAVA